MIKSLDGLTILRFAKAFKSGGGLEKYLEDLDKVLLKRNKVKIIRIYLEKGSGADQTIKTETGQGNLVEIAMAVRDASRESNDGQKSLRPSKCSFLKKIIREIIIYNPIMYHCIFKEYLKRYYFKPGNYPIKDAGEKINRLHQEYKINLIVMHHVGTIDSGEIIKESKKLKIPFCFINHFWNDRFNNISIREQIKDASGIAGVSGVGLPKRLKEMFWNLSDGIDTELFNPKNANSVGLNNNVPTIIYPARITPVKGQSDLIKTLAGLKHDGFHARVVFAGKTENAEYEKGLRDLSNKLEVKDEVLFVGELNTEMLRDYLGISSIMGFPTYHQEGLGRILLEGQAMKVPPVSYIIGGTPEGVQHGRTGYLVRKGDVKTFKERIKHLLNDEGKRRRMGEEGRRFVEKNFSLDALAYRHENFYLSILNKAVIKDGIFEGLK